MNDPTKTREKTHEWGALLYDPEIPLVLDQEREEEAVGQVRPEVELPDSVQQRDAHLLTDAFTFRLGDSTFETRWSGEREARWS